MQYNGVFDIDEGTYLELTRQLFADTEAGKFNLETYPSIFHFVTRFNDPLSLGIENARDRIIAGIGRGKPHYKFFENLDLQFRVSVKDEFAPDMLMVIDACLATNRGIQRTDLDQTLGDLRTLFFRNPADFYSQVKDIHKRMLLPFFDTFPVEETARYLSEMENGLIVQFIALLRTRKNNADHPDFAVEKPFFLALAEKVSTDPHYLSKVGLRWFIFNDLHNTIVDYAKFLLDPVDSLPKNVPPDPSPDRS